MSKSRIRVVLDTNIYISAFFFGGKPKQVVDLAAAGKYCAISSFFILQELREKLLYKFHVPEDKADEMVDTLLEFVHVYPVSHTLKNISRDPKDNPVIETAVSGKANFIVTGDKDLLSLEKYENVRIVTLALFLKRIVQQ